MKKVNAHLHALHKSYLFSEIARKTQEYQAAFPSAQLLRLGIGDVSRPLASAVVRALCAAGEEMGRTETFRGYGPAQGYPFLREAVAASYRKMGAGIDAEDVFVSDGAKGDCASLPELLDFQSVIAVCDPVYPVYADSARMAGHPILFLPCREENGFFPEIPEETPAAVYLCSPNNPTGVAFSHEQLAPWVSWAQKNNVLLIFDSAYRDYVRSKDRVGSLFELPGAKEIGIECCSLSKGAGFTGLRCGWTVVPRENRWGLHDLWLKRQSTKTNGVAYPVQRAAEAALTEGAADCARDVAYYMESASLLRQSLEKAGYTLFGGEDAPYLWLKTPQGQSGWEWFDTLLKEKQIISTPGEGFGTQGAGFIRLSALGAREEIEEAARRLSAR